MIYFLHTVRVLHDEIYTIHLGELKRLFKYLPLLD